MEAVEERGAHRDSPLDGTAADALLARVAVPPLCANDAVATGATDSSHATVRCLPRPGCEVFRAGHSESGAIRLCWPRVLSGDFFGVIQCHLRTPGL